MRKRMTSLLLALALCLSLLPAAAFAAEADPAEQEQTKVVSGEQEETPAPEEPTEEEKPASGKQEQEVPGAEPAPQEAGSGTAVQAGEHTHYLCGGTDCTEIGHKEENMVTFKSWDKTDSLPESGTYYLTANVTMSGEYYPTGDVILCLNGHSITGDSLGYPPIYVKNKNTSFTLTDCNGDNGEYHFTKTTSTSDDYFGLWVSDTNGDITVTGGIVTGSGAKASGVRIENGTFNMYGGTICGNKYSGVYLAAYYTPAFNMYGGAIRGNVGYAIGGGVYAGDGTFTMEDGTISDNVVSGGTARSGGGVSVSGTFIMNGGTISNNIANDDTLKSTGGGVYVGSGSFTMSEGAVITGNSANIGGGVYVSDGKTFTMNGGTISNNTAGASAAWQEEDYHVAGGVYLDTGSTLQLSGAAVITGNESRSKTDNVYLTSESTITVGTLDDSASIGLTPQTVTMAVAENVSADSAKRFFSDDTSKYRLVYNSTEKSLVLYSVYHENHPVCGAACDHQNDDGTKEHGNLGNWVSVDNESDLNYYLFGTDRNVYLTANITVTSGITVSGYNALCLNGYTITANGDFDLFTVKDNGARFKITDCIGGGEITRTGGTGRAVVVPTSTITITSDDYTCHFDMYAGTITGNEVGVQIRFGDSVTVGGTVNIAGNTKENLHLGTDGKTSEILSIDPSLTQASRIGVSSSLTENGTSPIQVATGAENDALKYTEIFTADAKSDGYVVVKNGTELFLKKHTHDWTYTADNETKTITAACSNEDENCPLNGDGGSVQLKAPEGTLTYTGKDQLASTEGTLSTGETPTIKYMVGGGELAVGSEIRNAGTYTAVLSVGDKLVSVEYTIKPAELTIKANDASTVYGEAAVTNDVTYKGFVEGEDEKVLHGSLTYEFNYTPGSDIGHYSIKPQGLTSNNYAITFKAGTLAVEQRTVALNWHDFENRTYNDGKEVTATAGNLVNGDKIGVTVTGGEETAVGGPYTATATGLTGDKAKNYALPMNTEREYTIGLAKQTLTFEKTGNQSVTYGDTLTNAATNDCADKNGGAVSYTSSNENVATVDENGIVTGKKVGTVTITATAAAVDGKYAEATASYELTVTQRSISLSLRQITRKYGEPGVDFASALYIVDGSSLAKGDTLAGLKPSWSSAGVGTANVGTYDVNVYTWGNANYNVTFDGAQKLTVIPRPITVEVDAVSRVYGERNPNFIANTVTSGSLVEGDMLVLYLTTTATETSPVGKYDVTLASSDSPNYDVTIIGEKKLTVTPKSITVTVDAVSRIYGDENPVFTATAPKDALVGEDTIESLGLGLTSTATETSPVGKYDVTGSASNANYTVTIDGAQKLTVNRKPIHVPAAGTNELTYNGKTQTYMPDGLDTTYCEITGNTAKDVYVGGYTAYVSLKDPANTEWDKGESDTDRKAYQFRITPAPATVTVQDKKITAGQSAPELTNAKPDEDYTIDGVFEGDTLSIKLYYADPSDLDTAVTPDTGKAGTYAIVAAFGGTSNANYDVTFVSGTLTIENRPVFTYPVNLPEKTENGSVTVSAKSASAGMTVTVTVTPDDGFKLGSLTVTDQNGNKLELTDKGGGKYTFTMPAGKVDVSTAFVKTVENSPFTDVAPDDYYYEAIKWAAENGITGGIGNGLFGPEQPCTRAQIVTFLWRAAGSPEPKALSSFTDVVSGSYYEKAVAWATENGITNGTDETHFSPDAACTRAQAVTFLARAAKASAAGSAGFHDVADHAYYAAAVKWAVDNGITNGIGGGLFGPDNDCTRAQIVTFLYRAMK